MLVLMFPSSLELVQDATHLLADGHTRHDISAGHHDDEPTDEHGCSGPYHICICHSSSAFVIGLPDNLIVVHDIRPFRIVERLATPAPSGHLDRLFRPPTA